MDYPNATYHGYIDEDLKRIYDAYIDNIMRGCTPFESALRVHVAADRAPEWVRVAEQDPYVIMRKAAALKAFDANTAWSAETAVIHLLRMVENPYEKGTVKVAAIDRLNVLLGITEIEATGKQTLAQKSLADFYARRVKRTGDDASTDTPTTH
jgi:hypothetical protein